jgi:hypothetical protein
MYALLIVVCPFVLFLLAIVLSVLLRYTDSDFLVSSNSSYELVDSYEISISQMALYLSPFTQMFFPYHRQNLTE